MKQVLTNVRLSLPLLQGLRHRAVEERRPAAAIVREAVAQYLTRPVPARASRSASVWLRGLTRLSDSHRGPCTDDASVNHDHYLYGAPRTARPGHRRG